MPLRFPKDAKCLVDGCEQKVTHQFSLRMRRKDTGADWAPNLPAYFCTAHANSGAKITTFYEPNITGVVKVEMFAKQSSARRDYEIKL